MKQDPFSGLDQRLFADRTKQTTKQRGNETTLLHDNGSTRPRSGEATQPPVAAGRSAPAFEAAPATSSESPSPGNNASASEGENAPSKPAVASRTAERHTHDLYTDQIHWMNRLKLDLAEQHGAKVTSNGIVQLAVDVLRDDFKRRRENSTLFKALVRNSGAGEGNGRP